MDFVVVGCLWGIFLLFVILPHFSYKLLKCIAFGKEESHITGDVQVRLGVDEMTVKVLSGPEIQRVKPRSRGCG